MSKATAAIEKTIKAKIGEITGYKVDVGIYKPGRRGWSLNRQPTPEEQNHIDILEGQLKTKKENLKNVIDAEEWEALNPKAKPAKQAKPEVMPQVKAKHIPKGVSKAEQLKPKINNEAIAAFIDGADTEKAKTGMNNIYCDGRLLQDITTEVLFWMEKANKPPKIFSRSGALVRLHDADKLIIEPLSVDALSYAMSLAANYFVHGDKKDEDGNDIDVAVFPPKAVAKNILVLDSWPEFPKIKRVIETPVVRMDGSVLSEPGYDPSTQLYLNPIIDVAGLKDIPEDLTKEDARNSARFILDEILVDFPFVNNASKTNTLALLLAVVARPLIDGLIPLAILDKPQAGTGASLLADIMSLIARGAPANMKGAPSSGDEWRKAITSCLLEGGTLIVIDNVVGRLQSSELARVLTSKIWSDRMLGFSKDLNLPQDAVWIATGNNIQIGGDIARRAYWIKLDAEMPRPWLRDEFKHPNITGWIHENHALILRHLVTIVRAWVLAGSKPGSVHLGSFEEWAQTLSGILEFAEVKGFMGNATEMYDKADQGVQEWDRFLEQWQTLHQDHSITAAYLREELVSCDVVFMTLQEAMPEDVAEATKKARSLQLGQVLGKHRDQVYPSGRRLTSMLNEVTNTQEWKIEIVNSKGKDLKNQHLGIQSALAV